MIQHIKNTWDDIVSSIVVVLVALPLCLGIALASGAPLFSGIIAGIVGGIVIGFFSGSSLSVSGPAAGLAVIVFTAIGSLPSYNVFLLAVVLAGAMQIGLGFARAGVLGDFIPNAVIKGMLAAIGLLLILKQLPHILGYDADYEGDESFFQPDHENTFSSVLSAANYFTGGAMLIGMCSLAILIIWELPAVKRNKIVGKLPGALLAVLFGLGLNIFFIAQNSPLALQKEHLVVLPIANSTQEFLSFLSFPDWSYMTSSAVWITAVTLALVASVETLLGIEAIDKLDPQKRVTPTNRELKAQGLGNIISGLIGGLPLTSVIVRSSANVASGAKSKLSTILHGIFLALFVMFIPKVLNMIPLSSLAAVLIFTGYKIAKVSIFKDFYKKGWDQFLPFIVTIVAILFTDLLKGILVGLLLAIIFIIRNNFKTAIMVVRDRQNFLIRFRKDITFLNKAIIKRKMYNIPAGSSVLFDVTRADFIDKDVVEEINNFFIHAKLNNIAIELKRNASTESHQLLITA